MAEKKPNSREQVKQIVSQIESGIQALFQSERYADYLRTMSRFHSYSYNNTILIHMQMPNATRVAGFNKWKNQFGRHVKKGEKGLTIIAPTPFKKKIEEIKLDPDTKAPMLDQDGNAIMEEREIEIPLFHPVKVFDVSQTEGRPLPSLASDLTGDVQQYEAFMEALWRTSPVPMEVKPIAQSMDGFFSNATQSITIRAGMSQVQTVCAAVHEIAHSILHNREQTRLTANAGDETKEPPKPKNKNTQEVEAESVSYAVCQYFGIETAANSLGYIATWSRDRTLPELKASLETISKTVNGLINDIDRHFAEVCKERGIDLTAQQPERGAMEAPSTEAPAQGTPPAPEHPDSPERFMDDVLDLMDRLYQEGKIAKTFPQENREQLKAALVRNLQADPSMVRAVLEKFVREDTGAAEAGALLDRLEGLIPPEPLEIPQTDQQEAVYLLDDSVYLHIQASDGGWDYTLYTRRDMAQLDGGRLDVPSMADVVDYIRTTEEIGTLAIELAPMEVLDELRDAADQAAQTAADEIKGQRRERVEELREHFAQEDAPLWDTTLDEYPVPDDSLTLDDLLEGSDLLPLSREQAAGFLNQDMTVYMVEAGKDPAMVFDHDDLMEQPAGMMFAVPRDEWEKSPDFRQAVAERMQRQEQREQAFLDHGADCFAIYQVRADDPQNVRFMGMDWLRSKGIAVERSSYDLVYTGELAAADSIGQSLENLYETFNLHRPADYCRPSLSVSDIIALKRDGVVTCHYCDSVGFERLTDFLTPKPTVAELEAQVKAGQTISLMDLADAVHREKGQKRSVVAQLKSHPRQGHKTAMSRKSAETER